MDLVLVDLFLILVRHLPTGLPDWPILVQS